jgi:hypothetical protein
VNFDGERLVQNTVLHRVELPSRSSIAGFQSLPSNRHGIERAHRQGTQKLSFRLGEIDPVFPVLRAQHDNLSVVIWLDVRVGVGCPHCKRWRHGALALAPGDRRKRLVVRREAMLGFGVFPSANSKNAEAEMRQRLLLVKLRPSDLKLKTGPPRGPDGGKLQFIGASSMTLPAARITVQDR